MDFNELKVKALELKKSGNYINALECYKRMFDEHENLCGKWEAWGRAFCLNRLSRFDEALEICRKWYKHDPDFEYMRSAYANAIYGISIQKKTHDDIYDNEHEFFKAANAIISITKEDDLFRRITVMKVIDYLKKKENPSWSNIYEWTGKIDPKHLPTEVTTRINSEGKNEEFASEREKWFMARSKASLELKRYDECAQICDSALRLTRLHYNNEIWFRMRMLLAKWRLGEKNDDVINQMKQLVVRKNEWFLHFDLAEFLSEVGDTDGALGHAIEAMLGHGSIALKGKVLLLLAKYYKLKGDSEMARNHVILYYNRTLQTEKAKNSEKVKGLLVDYGCAGEISEKAGLWELLTSEWKRIRDQINPSVAGIISKVLDNGSGFIITGTGENIYFRRSSISENDLKVGTEVSFKIIDSYDKKKQRMSKSAINIHVTMPGMK